MMMSSFLKVFSSKTQGQRYHIPRFEERFPFSWRIIVDGRPNRKNKASFQISPACCERGLNTEETFRVLLQIPSSLLSRGYYYETVSNGIDST